LLSARKNSFAPRGRLTVNVESSVSECMGDDALMENPAMYRE
jgi:hypothetical protein